MTQSEKKALITKDTSCIEAATILLFLKESVSVTFDL